MKFAETKIKGVFVIEPELIEDERGFFARTWCEKEFEEHGLIPSYVQCNISFNKNKGTLRGMHYQAEPWAEAKLIRCTKGSIYDVALDLRPESPSFKKWFSVELTAENRKMLYIPERIAHGFLTLEDSTEVFYQMSQYYHPESTRGARWDDPALHIEWPFTPRFISARDKQFEDFIL